VGEVTKKQHLGHTSDTLKGLYVEILVNSRDLILCGRNNETQPSPNIGIVLKNVMFFTKFDLSEKIA
jgi:hypothetical protein